MFINNKTGREWRETDESWMKDFMYNIAWTKSCLLYQFDKKTKHTHTHTHTVEKEMQEIRIPQSPSTLKTMG